jgi:mannose-6-phosphate isomerase-like protein (cupin superfamily)
VFALVALGAIGTASPQGVPRSFVASPDVYKVIAQDDKYLVIEVTWKPGQRDQFHSHPAAAVYRLTDCNTRSYRPDGTFQENVRKAGQSAVQAPIVSHSVENIGNSDCKIIMFEPK